MTTPDLENELRSAFTRAAADFGDPQPARHRLTQRHYHPASGHPRLATGITAAAASAAVVLGLGLSGAFGSSPTHAMGTIRTLAFTLTSYSNGTDTLTLDPTETAGPEALQNDCGIRHPGGRHHRQPVRLRCGAGHSPAVASRNGHRRRDAEAGSGPPSQSTRRPSPRAPAQRGRFPAQLERAAGRLRAHQHQLLHLQQHAARPQRHA